MIQVFTSDLVGALYIAGFVLSIFYLKEFDDVKEHLKSPLGIIPLFVAWYVVVPVNMIIRKVIHRDSVQKWIRSKLRVKTDQEIMQDAFGFVDGETRCSKCGKLLSRDDCWNAFGKWWHNTKSGCE